MLNIGSLGSDTKQCDFLSKLSLHLLIYNSGHVTNNVIINFASIALYLSHKVALYRLNPVQLLYPSFYSEGNSDNGSFLLVSQVSIGVVTRNTQVLFERAEVLYVCF